MSECDPVRISVVIDMCVVHVCVFTPTAVVTVVLRPVLGEKTRNHAVCDYAVDGERDVWYIGWRGV